MNTAPAITTTNTHKKHSSTTLKCTHSPPLPSTLPHTCTAANPSYQIRNIDPQAIGWHRVYKRRQKKVNKQEPPSLPPSSPPTPPPLANATAEHDEEGREGGEESEDEDEDEAMFEHEYVDDESISFLQSLWEERKAAAEAGAIVAAATRAASAVEILAAGAAGAAAAADPSSLLGPYMVFLLTSSPSDPFSLHLEALTTHLAPAFPQVLFLKGDGQKAFSGLISQISVKGLPQLLLFEENLLRSRYRAKNKNLKSILNFLVLHTGALPQAVIEGEGGREGGEGRFLIRLPRRREEGGMGWLYWVSALFVLTTAAQEWWCCPAAGASGLRRKEGGGRIN